MRLTTFLLGLLALPSASTSRAGEVPAFALSPAAVSKIVFLGDDATAQAMFTTLIETYELSRFPDGKFAFINTGLAGDTSAFTGTRSFTRDQALRRDIESLHPDVVLVNYGLNDARKGDAFLPYFTTNIHVIARDLPRLRVNRSVFVSVNPAEGEQPGAPAGSTANLLLQKYSAAMQAGFDSGWKDGVGFMQKHPKGAPPALGDGAFIDLTTPMISLIETGRKTGVLISGDKTACLMPDGTHPNWSGHLVMAALILQGLHAPALVSSASLDASARSTTAAQGCTITWLPSVEGSLSFRRTDASLPWPTPPEADLALQIPGFDPAATLNRYELRVTGLGAAAYLLSIDNQKIATYSASDLDRGINLGFARSGPIYAQDQQLLAAVEARDRLSVERWHAVIGPTPAAKPAPDTPADAARKTSLARLNQAIADAEHTIDVLRRPAPHVFTLTPCGKS